MTFWRFLTIACITALSLPGRSQAQEVDLSSQVRSIFLAKCSECHGRGLSRPKAALYLHELGPLAANTAWVVPFEPDKSYLWSLVRDDDMPAKGAKAGPLNGHEKEIIRAWIAAGAPVPAAPASPPPAMSAYGSADTFPPAPAAPFLATRILAWLGRFHVLVIHFPIALLATAALVEMIAAARGNRTPDATVRICVALGALGAVAAVTLGWLHADLGGHGSTAGGILSLHRWLGIAAGLWSIGVVLLSERDGRRGRRSRLFRILLWSGSFLVGLTAHFGGLLVHGSSFFDWS